VAAKSATLEGQSGGGGGFPVSPDSLAANAAKKVKKRRRDRPEKLYEITRDTTQYTI
jgi:hypothetical protein